MARNRPTKAYKATILLHPYLQPGLHQKEPGEPQTVRDRAIQVTINIKFDADNREDAEDFVESYIDDKGFKVIEYTIKRVKQLVLSAWL